ncbi:TIGR03086 family metal-binding protein [Gordonia sp. VNK21]|uniref:TIGR03086 family metal-binding protein n=1 Tax=Gordonia sp. VNK21 TaxID=3382483 RepID=UPI0038D47512
MTYTALDLYSDGLDFLTGIVHGTDAQTWRQDSPCAGWTALDVLGHVCDATSAGTRILAGEQFEFTAHQPPAEAVDGEPAAVWDALAAQARSALDGVDDLERVVQSPMGPRTVAEGLSFPAADLFLHGWDIAASGGRSVTIPSAAVGFIDAMFDGLPDEAVRRPGVFGPAVTPPEGATPTEALMARCGRDPRLS